MIKTEKACILWYFSIIQLKRLCPELFNHRNTACLCWWNKLKLRGFALVGAHTQTCKCTHKNNVLSTSEQSRTVLSKCTPRVCRTALTCATTSQSYIHSPFKDIVKALTPISKCNYITENIKCEQKKKNMFSPQLKAEVMNWAHHGDWEMRLLQTQQGVFMIYTMCSCVICKTWHNVSGI